MDIRIVTFDCYGTLVDWEGGLGTFLYDLARRNGDRSPGSGRELRERWEEIQFELIQGDYRNYSDVLVDALREFAGERGYRWNERHGEALTHVMGAWQPFPDTVPALRRARAAGAKLVIVSNTEHSIMDHTLHQLDGVEFDDVIVAEDVRAYKPSLEVFRFALERLSEDPANMLHTAFGFKYDIGPAQELGFKTAWVNRHAEPRPEGAVPDHEWRDLWGLAELAEAQRG